MRILLSTLALCLALPAHAALNIFACTPEWAALAKELAGEQASIYSATTALQDAHRIEARPSLIARARRAQLVVCTGAELESGWLPLVQAQSGNAAIQAGRPGYFEAAGVVELIEKPAKLDRAMGDVHAAGNPHLHLDARNIATIAPALAQRMAALDPADAEGYRRRAADFEARWREAMAGWERRAQPLKGMAVVVHHRDLSYLLRWLGMREAGALEPKPGLPPSTASLSELLETLKRTPASAVVRSAYADPRPSEWLAGRTGLPAVLLPFTVGGTPGAKDLFGLFDDTLDRLLAVRRAVPK